MNPQLIKDGFFKVRRLRRQKSKKKIHAQVENTGLMLEVENKIKTVIFPETKRDLKYLEQE